MKNIDVLIHWLDGLPHRSKKGHWPIWFEMGAGQRECMQCIFNRSGGPRNNRLMMPVFAPRPIGL